MAWRKKKWNLMSKNVILSMFNPKLSISGAIYDLRKKPVGIILKNKCCLLLGYYCQPVLESADENMYYI
jgi:hypothetical protein